ncbi:MAG TPA: hypothetical protein VFZ44_15730 [Pyrinomonadaceae bacterium]
MAKTRLCLLFAAVLLASVGVKAQKHDLGRIKLKTATLVSHHRDKDYKRSVFNFQHGVRGDKRFPGQPGTVALKNLPDNRGLRTHNIGNSNDVQQANELFRTADNDAPLGRQDALRDPPANRVRYDIRYGGIVINGDYRWLEVVERRGTQSVIKDLGAMSWDEVTHVPLLPASPEPYTGAITHNEYGLSAIRTRRATPFFPETVVVKAVNGHMYLLHVKDRKTEYYVMFRVESLDPNGECTLSWKRVPSPER